LKRRTTQRSEISAKPEANEAKFVPTTGP
jgi:hypothetical protein